MLPLRPNEQQGYKACLLYTSAGSLFPLLTLPVITVCSPSWRDTCSAVSPAGLNPPAMVSCALSRIMEQPSFP